MTKLCSLHTIALITALFTVLFLTSCRKEEEMTSPDMHSSADEQEKYAPASYDAGVVQPWYSLMSKLIIESPGHTPPIAAREIGYTGIALYEATVSRGGGHVTLAGQLSGLAPLPPRPGKYLVPTISANAALARIMKSLFGNATAANIARIDSLELALDAVCSASYTSMEVTKSRNYGRDIADAIYAWSSSDGGHQAYLSNFPSSYVPPSGSGYWVPTPPAYSPAMLPYWGSNRAFIPADNSSLINPPPHVAYSTAVGSDFYNAANYVYTTVNGLTQAQKDIATYWADGGGSFTPPGHMIAITAQLVRNKNLNLRDAVILLAKVGIGLNDAGIVCWRAKYDQNLMRPITYIKQNINANWNSYIGTPPFPSFTSGHSTFSAVTCAVLTKRFGPIAFTDSTKMAYGFSAKTCSNFTAASQEAALSRLYGGIHYEFDNKTGYDCGIAISLNLKSLRF